MRVSVVHICTDHASAKATAKTESVRCFLLTTYTEKKKFEQMFIGYYNRRAGTRRKTILIIILIIIIMKRTTTTIANEKRDEEKWKEKKIRIDEIKATADALKCA